MRRLPDYSPPRRHWTCRPGGHHRRRAFGARSLCARMVPACRRRNITSPSHALSRDSGRKAIHAGAYFKALEEVETRRKNSSAQSSEKTRRAMVRHWGMARDYKYRTNFPVITSSNSTCQSDCAGKRFYEPSDQGRGEGYCGRGWRSGEGRQETRDKEKGRNSRLRIVSYETKRRISISRMENYGLTPVNGKTTRQRQADDLDQSATKKNGKIWSHLRKKWLTKHAGRTCTPGISLASW